MLWPAGLCSTKTFPGLSRWFCITGVHRVWFTAVLFPLKEVPHSTPALTLVLVRCPFLHHRCSQEEEHTVSQPAEQDGGVVQLPVLGVALLLHFLCKLPAGLLHMGSWAALGPPGCVTPLKPYAPGETNLDSPCSVGWGNVLSAPNLSWLQVCRDRLWQS